MYTFRSRSSSFALVPHLALVFHALHLNHLFCALHSSSSLSHYARILALYSCFRVALVSPTFHSCPSRCVCVTHFALIVSLWTSNTSPQKFRVSHPDFFFRGGSGCIQASLLYTVKKCYKLSLTITFGTRTLRGINWIILYTSRRYLYAIQFSFFCVTM